MARLKGSAAGHYKKCAGYN